MSHPIAQIVPPWLRAVLPAIVLAVACGGVFGGAPEETRSPVVKIVTLGDSITKGVRSGVKPEETFAARLEAGLKAEGIAAEVLNVGIGGERTDQALKRLEADVISRRPRLVTIMYGTNDSYVDKGASKSRLPLDDYRANLKRIVDALRAGGIEPVLMTEPRWADDASPNGLGEHPNVRLAPYCEACRQVAREDSVPLVDHFGHWTEAEKRGVKLREWTTDGCHPNPAGHGELTSVMLPVVRSAIEQLWARPLDFKIRVDTVLKHDDGEFLWFHPRVAAVPGAAPSGGPAVVMTLQKHLQISDYYSGLSVMRSDDLGGTWTPPDACAELEWVREPDGTIIAVADVTPGWHAATGKLLAVGARVRYGKKGEQLDDKQRSHQTSYAVHDPKTGHWSRWSVLEMPEGEKFNFARSACAQWLVEPDGDVLLPFYFGSSASTPHSVCVVRCQFDGRELRYLSHGDELALDVVRGLVEPSLVRFGSRYFLTIRNDVKGYVTVGDDGQHFAPIKPWTFDDGAELGSYNTQQHWLVHAEGLFLVYTRRGADNDHMFRHRAPLFIARIDPEKLQVIRATERVLIPERGATLGNFGAAAVDENESWVTVAEGVWNDDARKRGAEGALFVARVTWSKPNGLVVSGSAE